MTKRRVEDETKVLRPHMRRQDHEDMSKAPGIQGD